MLNVIFIVGVIALRHLPTLLNVDVDVNDTSFARRIRFAAKVTLTSRVTSTNFKLADIFDAGSQLDLTRREEEKFTLLSCVLTRFQKLKAINIRRYSWNFGRMSNGKVHFGFFGPEYLGSPSIRPVRPNFDKPVHCPSFLRKRNEKWLESDSSWLAQFDRKISSHFPRLLA